MGVKQGAKKELNDIMPEHNQGMYTVPQILTNSAEDFLDSYVCENVSFFRLKIIPIKGRVDYKSVNWEFQFDKIIRIWTIDRWLQLT